MAKTLPTALRNHRQDLAAHALVYTTLAIQVAARKTGGRNAPKKAPSRRPQRQPKR